MSRGSVFDYSSALHCDTLRWKGSSLLKVFARWSLACSWQHLRYHRNAGGQVHHWHATSGKHLNTVKELGDEINSVDYHPTNVKFATGGSDFKVRVYDGMKCVLTQTLFEGDGRKTAGHSNRIFSVRWHPTDINICLSGGWDSTIQIWDTRAGRSVSSIFGPKICGDSLDLLETENSVLTGSWRTADQLQEWDYRSGMLITTFKWPQRKNKEQQCKVYSARYGCGLSDKLIAAGGSGSNEACLFNIRTGELIGGLFNLEKAVNSVCFSSVGDQLAITATDVVYMLDTSEIVNRVVRKLT